jgi:hypothetical protein
MDDSHLLKAFAGLELLQYAPYTPPSDPIMNCESVTTFCIHDDADRVPLAFHLDHNLASRVASPSRSTVNPRYTVPRKYRTFHAISNIISHAWEKAKNPFSSIVMQDRVTKLEGHRLAISINLLAKSILAYIRSPIWKCVGIAILPTMEEYRDAWVDLLQALINSIKISRTYTCFLALMPRAVGHDLKSILNKFRKDFTDSEKSNLQSNWRRLWMSPKWKFSEIERGLDDQALKGLCDTSMDTERTLFIGLSNIQFFAALLSRRPDAINGNDEDSRADLFLSLQVERVKDVLYVMNGARHILARNLEIAGFQVEV